MPAYITSMGRFLPGEPVSNEQIEDYIGSVGPSSTRLKDSTLANSGIKTRYYAIDKNQETVYTNVDMATAAIRDALSRSDVGLDEIELIASATTIPDLIAPGFASMVHGELGCPPCEIVTTHGVCSSGMMALKDAYLRIQVGDRRNAVVSASEAASRGMKSSRMAGVKRLSADGSIALELAFLRYMLSDGAGAAVLQDRPARQGVSLRIDWITLTSYANRGDKCMYSGTDSSKSKKGWLDYPTLDEPTELGALALRQNLALLPTLVDVGVEEYERLLNEGRFDPSEIRWFPAHYSSEIMKKMVLKQLARRGLPGPSIERWFSNLTSVGNIGSASIYVILEELVREGLVEVGDKLLCMVPESGRFAVAFMHLTAVSADAPDA